MMEIYCHSDMGKDSFRFEYDPVVALANAPKLLGMELKENGRQLVGGYYLDGSRHPYRKDKLKVFIGRGSVWVQEEGGRCISLPQWLMEYGGAADFKDALRMIKGESQAIHWNHEVLRMARSEVKYVSKDVLEGARRYELNYSPLFRHMCTLFDESRVRAVWNAYNVTANSKGATIFWYLNANGKICHDKVVYYGMDGHRIKTLPMGRQYRVGDGYSERVFFGSHLKEKPKGILESEKSCLYAACYFGGVWLATGGKGNLRYAGNIPLYADRDAEDEWSRFGDCVDWYADWPECGDHSDLGDKIEWEILHNKR